jgi:hypothetical protein
MIGLLEEPGMQWKRGFNTYDELWAILNSGEEITPSEFLPLGAKD